MRRALEANFDTVNGQHYMIVRIPIEPNIPALLKDLDVEIADVKMTPRQKDVMRGVMMGKANKEIANDMNVSERTVKFHVSCLLRRFGLRNRIEIVRAYLNAHDDEKEVMPK